MPSAELSPRARREAQAAARWIARDSRSAARDFRLAIIEAARLIGEHPKGGSVRDEFVQGPTRFFPVGRFPYLMAYNPEASPPLILRVVHAARDLPVVLSELN
jgi:toxin ParE1/3/4